MSNILKTLTLLSLAFGVSSTYADEEGGSSSAQEAVENSTEVAAETQQVDIKRVSESFGHLIGKNLESLGFDFDMMSIVKGIQDSVAGKISPMNENECIQAISVAQESAFQKQAEENLVKADIFLKDNAAHEGIVVVEKDRLQYCVNEEGTGAEVHEHFTPLIRYTGRFLDGTVFGASREEEMISLDEVISGFSKGIVGMKEGEKRTIFIHPELGYGTSGYLPPNSLLTFEIEVVKANATPDDQEPLTSSLHAKDQSDEEIAIETKKTDSYR